MNQVGYNRLALSENYRGKNGLALTQVTNAILKEIALINNSALFNKGVLDHPYDVFVYDETALSLEQQEKNKELGIGGQSFCYYDRKMGKYKIYVSADVSIIKLLVDKDSSLKFRGKHFNVADNTNELIRQLAIDIFKHELAHLRITSMAEMGRGLLKPENKFMAQLHNIIEDVRVNTHYDNSEFFKIQMNSLYKPYDDVKLSDSECKPNVVLLSTCITLNNPKYHHLFNCPKIHGICQDAFEKAMKAKSALETLNIARDWLEEVKKIRPNIEQQLKMPPMPSQSNTGADEEQIEVDNDENSQEQSNGNNNQNKQNKKEKSSSTSDFGDDYIDEEGIGDSVDYDDYDDDEEEEKEEEQNKPKKITSQNVDSGKEDDLSQNPEAPTDMDIAGRLNEDSQDSEELKKALRKIEENSFSVSENGVVFDAPDNSSLAIDGKSKFAIPEHLCVEKGKLPPQCVPISYFLETIKETSYIDKMAVKRAVAAAKEKFYAFSPKKFAGTDKLNGALRINQKAIADIGVWGVKANKKFLEKNAPKKTPVELTFFLDMSGSMGGKPVLFAQHLLSGLKALQNEKYVNINCVFHKISSKRGRDRALVSIVNLEDIKDKNKDYFLSALQADGDGEGLTQAIKIVNSSKKQMLKNSRFIMFLTDARINDEPKVVMNAIKQCGFENKKIIGLYLGENSDISILEKYFPTSISLKNKSDDISAEEVKKMMEVLAVLTNPDLSPSKALETMKQDKLVEYRVTDTSIYDRMSAEAIKEDIIKASAEKISNANRASMPKI